MSEKRRIAEWRASAKETPFVGGPLDGKTRMTMGIRFESAGAMYRPSADGKMQFGGYRLSKEP